MTKDHLKEIAFIVRHILDTLKDAPFKKDTELVCARLSETMDHYRKVGEKDLALGYQVVLKMKSKNIPDPQAAMEMVFGERTLPKSYHESEGYSIQYIESPHKSYMFAWANEKKRRNSALW